MIKRIILKNLFFYWQKIALTVALVTFLFSLILASFLFTNKIKSLADAPLNSLQTEIILQQDQTDKDASRIKTNGVIEPFNLKSFDREDAFKKLARIKTIKEISGALILWQFDIQNNRTIVGLNADDPLIGLRKIEQWLIPKSRFFSADDAQEVILERHFAKLFGYELNGQYQINDKKYLIAGIVDFKEQSNLSNAQVFIPYRTAMALIGEKHSLINQAYVSLGNASLLPRAQEEIENIFPNFTIITKDRLIKNLSSFNKLVYEFGDYLSLGIGILATVLALWIVKMNRMEFTGQTKILWTIGWPKQKIRQWIIFESFLIVALSLFASLAFLFIFSGAISPQVKTGPLLNQVRL